MGQESLFLGCLSPLQIEHTGTTPCPRPLAHNCLSHILASLAKWQAPPGRVTLKYWTQLENQKEGDEGPILALRFHYPSQSALNWELALPCTDINKAPLIWDWIMLEWNVSDKSSSQLKP